MTNVLVVNPQNTVTDFPLLRQTYVQGPEEAEIFTVSCFKLSFQ